MKVPTETPPASTIATVEETVRGSVLFWLLCLAGLGILTYFAVLLPINNNNATLVPASFLVLWAVLLYLCIALPVVGTEFPDTIVSAGRYLLVAVPVPLVLSAAAARYRRVLQSLVYLGVIMQVVFCVSYLSHLWIV
jgi:hypothetical protein